MDSLVLDRGRACRRALLLALFLAVLVAVPQAQRYHVRTYTVNDGLPSTWVRDIAQDQDGVLWFSTRAGVASYDGARWRTFGAADGLPLRDTGPLALAADGALWVASGRAPLQLACWNGSSWTLFDAWADNERASATCLAADSKTNAVYVASGRAGLLRFSEGRFRAIPLPADDDNAVTSLATVGRSLFVGTKSGLWTLALDTPDARPVPVAGLPASGVRGLAVEGTRLWVAWDDSLCRLEGGVATILADGPALRSFRSDGMLALEPDGAGGVYAGSPGFLASISSDGEVREFGRASGLTSDGATAFLTDREGHVWIANPRGATKVISRRFESWTGEHGLLEDEVTAIAEDPDGTLVLGHAGGLSFLRPDAPADERVRTLAFDGRGVEWRVMDLEWGPHGTLWIAASSHGLAELTPGGELFWHGCPPGRDAVVSLYADPLGVLWVGAARGLFRFRDGAFEEVDLGSPEPPFPRRLAGARDGSLLLAAAGVGLVRRSPDGDVRTWSASTPGARDAYCVLERAGGDVLVGTADGLFEARDGELERAPAPLDTIERPVYFLFETPARELWIGTDNGVQRLDERGLRGFGPESGLLGLETNRDAVLQSRDGAIWIGTDSGVSAYDPRRDPPPRAGPTLKLLSFESGDEAWPADAEAIELAAETSLRCRFRAISFADEERVAFQHRLVGLDADWSRPRRLPGRDLQLTSLPAGSYRLQMRAVDVHGLVSAVAESPPLVVLAPVWRRSWFLALGALLGAALIGGAFSLAVQRRHASFLEREVERRTAQLAESERAVVADRQRLAATLARIADGVATTDARGRVVLWNSAAEVITGRAHADVQGLPLRHALGCADLDGAPEAEQPSALERWLPAGSQAARTASGEERTFELSVALLHDVDSRGAGDHGSDAGPGRTAGAVVAFRDVTDRVERERDLANQERLEALGILAGGIAHDFNNYLTAILGTVGLVLECEPLGAELRSDLMHVAEASERARGLTQQLLTFARGGTPVRRAVRLERLVRDTVSFALYGSSVKSAVAFEEGLLHAHVDEEQVAQVLHNLLLNARQAMPEGGTVHVRVSNHVPRGSGDDGAPYVRIEVEDEGPGIPPEDRAHVFDPFFTRRAGGTGLGLAVAFSVVRRHAGRITVESPEGRGALFRILLPATDEQPERLDPSPVADLSGKGRVLVMDDMAGALRATCKILDQHGYEAVPTPEGEAAVKLYRRSLAEGRRFDLVILDLVVPGGMGGVEAAQHLLALDPQACIVAVSGYSDNEVMAEHARFGFRASLAKPFRSEDLAALAKSLLTL